MTLITQMSPFLVTVGHGSSLSSLCPKPRGITNGKIETSTCISNNAGVNLWHWE